MHTDAWKLIFFFSGLQDPFFSESCRVLMQILPHTVEKREKKLKGLELHILFSGIYFVHVHGSDGVKLATKGIELSQLLEELS